MWDFGTDKNANDLFHTFIQESEHLNAFLEYQDNAPPPVPSGNRAYTTRRLCEIALNALRRNDEKYCIQQPRQFKKEWTVELHEIRYTVRIVQWCRSVNGRWSGQPLSLKMCERAIMLLKYLRYELHGREGAKRSVAIRKAIDDGLDAKRRREMGVMFGEGQARLLEPAKESPRESLAQSSTSFTRSDPLQGARGSIVGKPNARSHDNAIDDGSSVKRQRKMGLRSEKLDQAAERG